jgi:hypothetical protein
VGGRGWRGEEEEKAVKGYALEGSGAKIDESRAL